ncbi:MAG: ferritin-like domain-containing protein [Verrucomicrobiota bacterium]|nr:ferritin-like domain-containing protein [Verrucomicrobiota bacterium]
MNNQNETSRNSNEPDQSSGATEARIIPRRSFLRSLGLGATLLGPGGAILASTQTSLSSSSNHSRNPAGDVAILQFLAAAELIEADLWQQYTELALNNPAYGDALSNLDGDMGQYISDNTDDELSHANFLNAFLHSIGERGVNLDPFRTLPSSHATGAQQIGRLTNLMNLTVDTSWWLRYRSDGNPDFGDSFPQLIDIANFPTIPNADLPTGSDQIQAIANAAAFHFAAIEQGGSSLYASFIPKATLLSVLNILAGIGGSEVAHFTVWHDKAGNAPAVSVPGVTFPDLAEFDGDELRQKNLILPEPCKFISGSLPPCSVIRPATTANAGAVAAVNALTHSGLFNGQSPAFFHLLATMAHAADAARRNPF